jgi:diamine N-acetyltransferase
MHTQDAPPLGPLEPVAQGDGEALAAYSRQVYDQHYGYLWFHAGSDWYQEKVFDAATLDQELLDPGIRHYYLHVAGERAGFLRLLPNCSLDRESGGMEISRLYVAKDFQRQGLGRQAMDAALRLAESLGRRYLWLQVMECSQDAVRFYESLGFEQVAQAQLPYVRLKPQFRTILTMRKALEREVGAQDEDGDAVQ